MSTEKNHAEENAKAWASTICSLVAALDCDYGRLEELRDERADISGDEERMALGEGKEALASWDAENGEELKELTAAATIDGDEMKDAEAVRERIQESPLSVQVRSGWHNPGEQGEAARRFGS